MEIRKWHTGKLVLLWLWGLVLIGLALNLLEDMDNPVFGSLLLLFIITAPIGLSVVSWKWLSGKEK